MNDKDNFSFKVSRSYILLPSNKTTTEVISIDSECFKLGLMIKITHNLPDGFITDFPKLYIDSDRKIHITYRGSGLDEQFRPKDLFILFTDTLNSKNSKKVILEIVDGDDEEDEVNAEVLQVEEQYQNENPFECQICFDQYSENETHTPIILECGHTLCYSCVLRIIMDKKPQCPFDRKKIKPDLNLLTIKNYNLLLIMEHERKKPEPKVIIKKKKKVVCEETMFCEDPDAPCAEDPNHESTCFCNICQLDFCHNCFLKVHPPSKTMKTHKLVTISEKPIVLPKCVYHPLTRAALICKNTVCPMFNEKYCWQCAHERHKHLHPQSLENLMVQNKRDLLQVSTQLSFKKEDFSKKATFLSKAINSYESEWELRKRKVRSDEKKKLMFDLLDNLHNSKGYEEWRMTEYRLDGMSKVQKRVRKALLRTTGLYDVENLIVKAKEQCSLQVGAYEHLVPQAPYDFPEEDSPEEPEPIPEPQTSNFNHNSDDEVGDPQTSAEETTSSFFSGLLTTVREMRPLRFGRKRRILNDDEYDRD